MVLIDVAHLLGEVYDFIFDSKECPSHLLKCKCLNQWPFLDRLLFAQHSNLFVVFHDPIKL